MLSGKGGLTAETARRLAEKPPPLKRVRNSSLVESLSADNVTGLSTVPKLRISSNAGGRGAFPVEEGCL